MKLTTGDTGKRQREEAEALKDKVAHAAELERGWRKNPVFCIPILASFTTENLKKLCLLYWRSGHP